ncbi:MAG: hypothetical protein WA213_15225 [Terriglobales bacterium]
MKTELLWETVCGNLIEPIGGAGSLVVYPNYEDPPSDGDIDSLRVDLLGLLSRCQPSVDVPESGLDLNLDKSAQLRRHLVSLTLRRDRRSPWIQILPPGKWL